jgi:hypothetical protein
MLLAEAAITSGFTEWRLLFAVGASAIALVTDRPQDAACAVCVSVAFSCT